MADLTDIARSDGWPDIPASQPFWFLEGGQVNLIRGGCGKHLGRLTNHTIEEDGRVHASILCPNDKCRWHVFGRLLDWTHGRKAPRQRVKD